MWIRNGSPTFMLPVLRDNVDLAGVYGSSLVASAPKSFGEDILLGAIFWAELVESWSSSGINVSGDSMRKCSGVSAEQSFGSLDNSVIWQKLSIVSIFLVRLMHSRRGRMCSPMTLCRWHLSLFTVL